MPVPRAWLFLPIAMTLQACQEETPKNSSAINEPKNELPRDFSFRRPEINLETPDNAVKSWWRVIDAKDALDIDLCNYRKNKVTALYKAQSDLTTGNTQEYFKNGHDCHKDDYSRRIEKVNIETETRAIVFANVKNITPVPEGVKIYNFSKNDAKNGVAFKYVLTKENGKWLIEEMYRYNSSHAILKEDPWSRYYEKKIEEEVSRSVYFQ